MHDAAMWDVRDMRTGHRIEVGHEVRQTRDFRPLWILPIIAPLEIAARWRARLENRYGVPSPDYPRPVNWHYPGA